MGIFGWSLPPGCGTLPGEETGSVALDVPGLPERMGAWWTEDDLVGVTEGYDPRQGALLEYDDGTREHHVGTVRWDDDLTEAENMARAVAVVVAWLERRLA